MLEEDGGVCEIKPKTVIRVQAEKQGILKVDVWHSNFLNKALLILIERQNCRRGRDGLPPVGSLPKCL